jgi:GNAT superfamily N-acetyltransferase
MQLIRMTEDHLAAVSALSGELGFPTGAEALRPRFQRLIANPRHALLVASREQTVIGFIHAEIVDDLVEEEKVEIKVLVVSEKYRGQNIGHALVEEIREWARINRLGTLYLSCNILRERAHEFYHREGFALNRTSHIFELKI